MRRLIAICALLFGLCSPIDQATSLNELRPSALRYT